MTVGGWRFFRAFGAWSVVGVVPKACALGCNLAPLRGCGCEVFGENWGETFLGFRRLERTILAQREARADRGWPILSRSLRKGGDSH